jgi:F0F1-type ATP synthase epsilon subunit
MEIIRTAGDSSGRKSEWAAITSGFAEVDGSRVVVLVDSCALAEEIDRDATESRRVEADDALLRLPDDEANAGERARLCAVVARAELELEVAGRSAGAF